MKTPAGSGPKPRRGGMFIDRSPSHPIFFLFFGGAGTDVVCLSKMNRATELIPCAPSNSAPSKTKKKEVWGASVAINRPPLRGLKTGADHGS